MSQALESLSLERLEEEIGELAAHINAASCQWLLLVAEYDRREGWKPWGCKSCAEWLSLRCGVALGAGREQVRVARRLAELPLVSAAFARGELSYSKVRAISRVASEQTEADLLELAIHATAAQLEQIVRGYRRAASTEQPNQTHAERFSAGSGTTTAHSVSAAGYRPRTARCCCKRSRPRAMSCESRPAGVSAETSRSRA